MIDNFKIITNEDNTVSIKGLKEHLKVLIDTDGIIGRSKKIMLNIETLLGIDSNTYELNAFTVNGEEGSIIITPKKEYKITNDIKELTKVNPLREEIYNVINKKESNEFTLLVDSNIYDGIYDINDDYTDTFKDEYKVYYNIITYLEQKYEKVNIEQVNNKESTNQLYNELKNTLNTSDVLSFNAIAIEEYDEDYTPNLYYRYSFDKIAKLLNKEEYYVKEIEEAIHNESNLDLRLYELNDIKIGGYKIPGSNNYINRVTAQYNKTKEYELTLKIKELIDLYNLEKQMFNNIDNYSESLDLDEFTLIVDSDNFTLNKKHFKNEFMIYYDVLTYMQDKFNHVNVEIKNGFESTTKIYNSLIKLYEEELHQNKNNVTFINKPNNDFTLTKRKQ